MTFERKFAIGCSAYIIGGWLSFGWHYNRPTENCAYYNAVICETNHELGSAFKGIFWPGYWIGRLAIEVTKP